MPILVKCSCGKQLRAPDSSAGRRIKCPSCAKAVEVPNEQDEPEAPAASEDKIRFGCSGCGKTIQARAELAGRKTRCPSCDGER